MSCLVESKLNALRLQEILTYHGNIPSSFNFREARSRIEMSPIFQSFLTMPKGGNLHLHTFGHTQFLLENGTYRDDCFINLGAGSKKYPHGFFLYTSRPPGKEPGVDFQNVNQLRDQALDVDDFDQSLYAMLQFETPTPLVTDKEMWQTFNEKIHRTSSLTSYLPVFKSWLSYSFKKAFEDKVQHIEMRKQFSGIYDNNRTYAFEEILPIIYDTLAKFNAKYNATLTLQFIVPSGRGATVEDVFESMKSLVDLRENGWKDKLVGFDLVDHEDGLNPLIYYLDAFSAILQYSQNRRYDPLPFYFHAGESKWFNGEADLNLYDAILLNTTRIGHGFSLLHHPKLRTLVSSRKIAIEVSPTSNQLLRYVHDLRNHPAHVLLSEGVPMTLSTDDPDVFGYSTLAYEYYHVYTAWGVRLNTIKQLSMNGILYSSLSDHQKRLQLKTWGREWDAWIKTMLV